MYHTCGPQVVVHNLWTASAVHHVHIYSYDIFIYIDISACAEPYEANPFSF